ncbi:unnamed protein product [Chondrus crispus]|uniref:Uncharacterized protein n=1 Tax=Chondrus crispus TaxID=2769 RepID=R7QKK8_CHOCR|nr:unnamed protein product [Chondrus crispus]CDF37991.1 unnamed protein product [Chondrus crispus]|eukprot:XP_005717860.1 unnamed protein product [Chondrus crispus]
MPDCPNQVVCPSTSLALQSLSPIQKVSNHPKKQAYLSNMFHRCTCFLLALLVC